MASESLFVSLPHLSVILHHAPVSGCIFSGNTLEQLRMTQFSQGPGGGAGQGGGEAH